jgi:iron complex outermembrane recepter protein
MHPTFTLLRKSLLILFVSLFAQHSYAQISLTGKVSEAVTNEPLAGVSIRIVGKVAGTITDAKGEFSFSTTSNPPFTIMVSSVGFQSQEIEVAGGKSDLDIKLVEQPILGREIVVSTGHPRHAVYQFLRCLGQPQRH